MSQSDFLRDALATLQRGESLGRSGAREAIALALQPGFDAEAFADLLRVWAESGETADEITGAAEALRAAMQPFEHSAANAVDTAGTGGDGLGSFNLSTAAALVAAAAGALVVKHGNRSVSSKCGSADLLEAAGVVLELSAEQARGVFEEVGIVFLYAPAFHPAMRHVAPVRKALGIRTVFNYLGPLCNPGGVRRQLLGVNERERLDDFATALASLGHERALVVHGAGGADELTLAGPNEARAVGAALPAPLDAAGLGLTQAPVDALAGGDATRNLELLRALLDGSEGPLRDATCLNAAATLWCAGHSADMHECLAAAADALGSGAAKQKLADWVAASQRVSARAAG